MTTTEMLNARAMSSASRRNRHIASGDEALEQESLHPTSAPPLSMGATRVSVVIPTLNEAANLPHILPLIPTWVHEIVIVDGHSTDDTIKTARALCPSARLIMQEGHGKGNALACGFAAARGDIIVMLDADGSTDPAEIPAFIAQLLDGADFVKGSRYMHGGASSDITFVRSTGNKALCAMVNLFYGTRYTDLCYGYNAFWRYCLPYMQITCDGFEVETVINVRVAKAGLTVAEVPSHEWDRIHGLSNLSAWRDGTRILKSIVCERLRALPAPNDSWHPSFLEVTGVSGSQGLPGGPREVAPLA